MNAKCFLTSGIALCVLVVAVLCTACKKDDSEPQVEEIILTVGDDIAAAATEGAYPVTITCNTVWTAAVNSAASWCTVAPPSGNGNGTVTVTLTSNTGETRSAALIVHAGTATKTVTVTQLGTTPALVATGNGTANMSNIAGSTATIGITANVTWTAAVNSAATWCTIDPGAGTNSGTIVVTATLNPAEAPARTANITIRGGMEVPPVVIQVSQEAGAPVELTVTPDALNDVSSDGVTSILTIETPAAWTASVNTEWCTVTPPSGTGAGAVTVKVNRSFTDQPRAATITVQASASIRYIGVTQQAGSSSLDELAIISDATITAVPATNSTTAPSYHIQFVSAANWSAAIEGGDTGWLSLSSASGNAGADNTLTVTVNYFKGDAGASSVVITSGGHTAAVQVIDNYADQAITHGANQWSPTDLLDPGKFAPAIGKGKVYQHGRNYGWSLLDGVPSEFPKTNANQVTLGDGTVLPAYPAKENPEDPIPDALPWTTSPCPAGWALPTDAQAKTIPDVCQNIAGVTIDGLPFRTAGGLHILEQNIEEGGSKSNRAEMWTKEGGANLNSNAVNFKQSCYARTVYKGLWVRCIKEE